MHKLTMQQTFDKVSRHLFKQGRPSVSIGGTCLYRGPNNTRCAVGCLIPDELYQKKMDCGFAVQSLFNEWPNLWEQFDMEGRSFDDWRVFLRDLQRVHDSNPKWSGDAERFDEGKLRSDLENITINFKLDASVLHDLKMKDQ